MQLPVMFSAKWDRKNIVSLCTDAALTPANQMVSIIGGLPTAHTGLSLYPGKKIRVTQRMRFGRAKNVAGASESTMTSKTGFAGGNCTAVGAAAD